MNAKFNRDELRLARIFNGLTLEDVAGHVGKSRQYIHKLETGQAIPTSQLLEQLASTLQVEPGFLISDYTSVIKEEQFHFRKLFTTGSTLKQEVMARGEFVSRLVNYLEHELQLPNIRIPDDMGDAHTPEKIEKAAERCRYEWGVGFGPIANMSRLAENAGVIITSFPSLSKEIDALSVAAQRPIIVCNEAKESVCRQRFDIGHELGHFVLHVGTLTGDRVTENQANRFASSLLLPRTMMAKFFPKPKGSRLDWIGLSEFKKTWKVSKAAILYRASQLDLISEAQYKSGVITLKREPMKEKEDDFISPELPELLSLSFKVLADKRGIYLQDVAKALRISPNLLDNVIGKKINAPIRNLSISERDNCKQQVLRLVL